MDKNEQRLKMIGASIKRMREKSGYSQVMVATHLDITEKTYSEYERGKTQPPLLKLIAIAEFFECGLDELLVGISPAPDDQAKHIASLLHGLKRADRHHIVKIVEKIVLIAKGKIKIDT